MIVVICDLSVCLSVCLRGCKLKVSRLMLSAYYCNSFVSGMLGYFVSKLQAVMYVHVADYVSYYVRCDGVDTDANPFKEASIVSVVVRCSD